MRHAQHMNDDNKTFLDVAEKNESENVLMRVQFVCMIVRIIRRSCARFIVILDVSVLRNVIVVLPLPPNYF